MRKITLLFVVQMLMISWLFAQSHTVTGKVTDENGAAIAGASVLEKGTKNGTSTNMDGSFSLEVKKGAILTIASIGFDAKEVKTNVNNLLISLLKSTTNLSEVVVTTALGVKREAKELGYAATTLQNKFITQAKATNVQQALNGKISGVNVSTVNSGVFEDAKINIRGIRSLTGNNQPLFILDGQPVSLSYLSSISPEDIQDETILKGANSAAIYGSDAVNGVIVVNTKKGTSSKTPIINFSTTVEATKVAYFPKLQHEFGPGAGETLDQYGNFLYVPYENQIYGPRFDGSTKMIGRVLEDGTYQSGPYSNLHKNDKTKFWNTGLTVQNMISYTGDNFYMGVSDANVQGLMPGDKNRRTTFRLNAGKDYKRLSVSYGLDYTLQNWDITDEQYMPTLFANNSSYTGSVMFSVLQVGDNIPLLSYKDWRNNKWAQFSNYYNDFAINPYWITGNLRQKGSQNDLIGHVDASYKIASWLKANVKLSSNVSFVNYRNTVGAIEVSDWAHSVRSTTQYTSNPGKMYDGSGLSSRINLDYYLNGEKNLNKDFSIKYVLGGMLRQDKSSSVNAGGNNQIVKGVYNIGLRLDEPTIGTDFTYLTRRYSAYGSLLFSYKNWAFVEFTGRNDWDSRLAPKSRSYFYPGVNGSVILSEAIPSIKDNTPISYLKFRAAYSKTGNVNIGTYALNTTYSQFSGFPYGTTPGFIASSTDVSPKLTPEFVKSLDLGLEVSLLKNRIGLEVSYYNQNNDNQVIYASQSWTTGFSTFLANAASFKNNGVEFDLNFTPLVNVGKGRIDVRFNASYNDNKVTQTLNNSDVVIGGNGGFIQNSVGSASINLIAKQGSHAFMFQGYDYARDSVSGKVIVDASSGYPSQATTTTNFGRTLPLWVLGITPTYTVGNFSVSMTWDYKTGNDYYAGIGGDMDFSGISARSAEYGRQRFVFPNSVYLDPTTNKYVNNTNIMIQDGNIGFWTNGKANTLVTKNYMCSAKALRLREINISYTIPAKWLGNASKVLKRVTVSAIGRNLLLILPKSNQWGDPEFNYTSTGNTYGVSSSYQTPASRFFGGTLSLQF